MDQNLDMPYARQNDVGGALPFMAASTWQRSPENRLSMIERFFAGKLAAKSIQLMLHDPDVGTSSLLYSTGEMRIEDDSQREYSQFSANFTNPLSRRKTDLREKIFWRKIGFEDFVSISFSGDANEKYVLSASFESGGFFDQEAADREICGLYPVLEGYFRLWRQYHAERRRSEGLENALNISDVALILLDKNHAVTFANTEAQELLMRGDGLKRSGATITAIDGGDAVRLHAMIEHIICNGGVERGMPSSRRAAVMSFDRPDASRPLLVTLIPPEHPPSQPGDPAVIICGMKPDANVGDALVPVCRLYALSPAETRLVCSLAEGRTLAESAKHAHLKLQTARTYLKQVFQKTNTNRQADLIRVMLSSLLRTRAEITAETLDEKAGSFWR